MSTFKEISENTITNNGESISGRLVYNWFTGTESKPVYFGLKDGAGNWGGNLSTKGTSAFYLTSNVSGCTAQVKDSTYTPTTGDATTAREIWLNIPSTTTSRTIQFSYNGTTLITVKQYIKVLNEYIFSNPVIRTDDVYNTVFALVDQDISYNERLISENTIGFGGLIENGCIFCINYKNTNNTDINRASFRASTVKNANITYIRGVNLINQYPKKWIATIPKLVIGTNDIATEYNEIPEGTVFSVYTPTKSGNPTFISVGTVSFSNATFDATSMVAKGE